MWNVCLRGSYSGIGLRVSGFWTETAGDSEIPIFSGHVFSVEGPNVGRSVKAGQLWKAVRVRVGWSWP